MLEPPFPHRQILAAEQADRELLSVLRDMVDCNEDISMRAVVRRMSTLSQATALTRDRWRSDLVHAWQKEQQRLRSLTGRWDHTSKEALALRAETDRARISALETEAAILRAGLVALIRAVGEQGAFRRWRSFFDGYEQTFAVLKECGVLPEAAVVQLEAARSKPERK